jgi:2-polyprenyl-3-methyl-5-hydroxy-6-metoxy-1,4-benzoquinol methylase
MCGKELSNPIIMGQRLNATQGKSPKKKAGISVSVIRCRNCGLISSQPMPVPADFQQHYGILPETFWNQDYYNLKEDYFASEIETARKLLGATAGKKALDIGAGIGKCMISMSKAGFDVYGCEPSEQFYEKALNVMKIDPARLKFGMVETLEYPEGEFDFITFGAVFEHLYHPAQCLERVFHWLKPGGIIHIEVPSAKYFVSKLFNLYYRLRGTNYVTNLSPMHVPFHLYEFTLRSFEELGKRLDFHVEEHQFYVCEIVHVPRIIKPILRGYMKSTNSGMQLTVYLQKNKG